MRILKRDLNFVTIKLNKDERTNPLRGLLAHPEPEALANKLIK